MSNPIGAVSAPTFLYLDFGGSPLIKLELRYSLSTLRAALGNVIVVVYTDRPLDYADYPVTTRDITSDLPAVTIGRTQPYRLKPWIVLDALTRFGGRCILLDTDTIIRPAFADLLKSMATDGRAVIMHKFEWHNPLKTVTAFATKLPSGASYHYDPVQSVCFNSGVIAVRAGVHKPALGDALALMDAFTAAEIEERTLEQICVSEALRVHGFPIHECDAEVVHYWSGARKRYMHAKLRPMFAGLKSVLHPAPPLLDPTKNKARRHHRLTQVRTELKKILRIFVWRPTL